jgi:hypothetical protein
MAADGPTAWRRRRVVASFTWSIRCRSGALCPVGYKCTTFHLRAQLILRYTSASAHATWCLCSIPPAACVCRCLPCILGDADRAGRTTYLTVEGFQNANA